MQNLFYLNCPELISILEELDIETQILTIENFIKECKLEKKSKSIDLALHNIYQIIVLFKIELNKIHKVIVNHKNKFFNKIRKPNYKISIDRLKMYSKLLDKRMNMFMKTIENVSSVIKFEK